MFTPLGLLAEAPSKRRGGGVKGNSDAIYRYRREQYFAKPPAAIWPFVSDSARLWELSGFAPYRIEERVDGEGRVRRFVRGKVGPFPARWEEDFGEWQENHRLFQTRDYKNGPMRRWEWTCELIAEGEGCRLILTGMAEPAGLLGFVGKRAGIFDAEFGKACGGDRADHSRERRFRAGPGLERRGPDGARRPPTTRCARRGTRARSRFPCPRAEPHRLPATCADRRSAQHASDRVGETMVRPARPRRGVVPGGGAKGRRGDGMGAALPALPRREVPREQASRPAERRALLLLQHRLRSAISAATSS